MASEENKAESGGADAVKDEVKEVNDQDDSEKDAKGEETAVLTEENVVEEEKGEEDEGKSEDKEKEKEKEKEMVTPRERPARERKAVDRFWLASPATRPSAPKSLSIEKGSGTPLKDIPNVAFKLSKRKPDDNLQLLHTILFGKKAKVHTLKRDIGQFSGFVWTDNEEKQRAKMKEKLDKCVKEKLLHFCDVLNIPINKGSVRKEDLTVKLLEFLESPHPTTEELLADKDQKGKSKKRKSSSGKSRNSKAATVEKSAKKTQSGEKRKRASKVDEDIETDHKDDDMESQSHSSEEDDDAVEKQESDDAVEKQQSDNEDTESEEEKDEVEEKMTPKSSTKVNSGSKDAKKSTNTKKSTTEKSTKTIAKSETKTVVSSKKSSPAEASAPSSKSRGSASKKQKVEEETEKEKVVPVKEKLAKKKQESKPVSKEKGKGKPNKVAKKEPTNDELRAQAVNILKEVDFNTATLSDILRLLGSHFGLDLMHRKVEVKAIITDVIENMSDEDDDDDDDEDEDSDEGAQDSGKE